MFSHSFELILAEKKCSSPFQILLITWNAVDNEYNYYTQQQWLPGEDTFNDINRAKFRDSFKSCVKQAWRI